jgi:hypothetical protein
MCGAPKVAVNLRMQQSISDSGAGTRQASTEGKG